MTGLRCIAFTDKGFALAQRLARALDGTALLLIRRLMSGVLRWT